MRLASAETQRLEACANIYIVKVYYQMESIVIQVHKQVTYLSAKVGETQYYT